MYSLMLLPPEGTSFCETCFASSGLTQHSRATDTQHYCLSMAEDCGDLIASWTLDVHEIRIRALHEPLLLVPPSLLLRGGVQQVFCELWMFDDFH